MHSVFSIQGLKSEEPTRSVMPSLLRNPLVSPHTPLRTQMSARWQRKVRTNGRNQLKSGKQGVQAMAIEPKKEYFVAA